MNNTINCPKCGQRIEIDKLLSHQIEAELTDSLKARHEKEIDEARRQAEVSATKKALDQYGRELERQQKAGAEEKERNRKLTAQIDSLLEEVRQLRRKDDDREIEMKRKLLDEEQKIQEETRKKVLAEHELKDLEKDKLNAELLKQINELKSKMQRGSQQTQGEVMELAIEELLRREFPDDVIEEVKKGQRGGDILQQVIDKKGKNCGLILWESKNARWSDQWIAKLKEDARQAKAHLTVLVVTDPPANLESFVYKEGVWVVLRQMVLPLALVLRFNLIRLNYEKLSHVGKNEKMEILYSYITSPEFGQRIEAITEAFSGLQEEMEREKRWFQTKWARQEKQLRRVIDHTQGMYGDLQGVIGKSLPEIKTLQLESGS